MPNPAQALADEAREVIIGRSDAADLAEALAAYDAWKPWEDEAVVERAAQALAEDEMRGESMRRWDWDADKEAWRAVARAALKAALGGDDA